MLIETLQEITCG